MISLGSIPLMLLVRNLMQTKFWIYPKKEGKRKDLVGAGFTKSDGDASSDFLVDSSAYSSWENIQLQESKKKTKLEIRPSKKSKSQHSDKSTEHQQPQENVISGFSESVTNDKKVSNLEKTVSTHSRAKSIADFSSCQTREVGLQRVDASIDERSQHDAFDEIPQDTSYDSYMTATAHGHTQDDAYALSSFSPTSQTPAAIDSKFSLKKKANGSVQSVELRSNANSCQSTQVNSSATISSMETTPTDRCKSENCQSDKSFASIEVHEKESTLEESLTQCDVDRTQCLPSPHSDVDCTQCSYSPQRDVNRAECSQSPQSDVDRFECSRLPQNVADCTECVHPPHSKVDRTECLQFSQNTSEPSHCDVLPQNDASTCNGKDPESNPPDQTATKIQMLSDIENTVEYLLGQQSQTEWQCGSHEERSKNNMLMNSIVLKACVKSPLNQLYVIGDLQEDHQQSVHTLNKGESLLSCSSNELCSQVDCGGTHSNNANFRVNNLAHHLPRYDQNSITGRVKNRQSVDEEFGEPNASKHGSMQSYNVLHYETEYGRNVSDTLPYTSPRPLSHAGASKSCQLASRKMISNDLNELNAADKACLLRTVRSMSFSSRSKWFEDESKNSHLLQKNLSFIKINQRPQQAFTTNAEAIMNCDKQGWEKEVTGLQGRPKILIGRQPLSEVVDGVRQLSSHHESNQSLQSTGTLDDLNIPTRKKQTSTASQPEVHRTNSCNSLPLVGSLLNYISPTVCSAQPQTPYPTCNVSRPVKAQGCSATVSNEKVERTHAETSTKTHEESSTKSHPESSTSFFAKDTVSMTSSDVIRYWVKNSPVFRNYYDARRIHSKPSSSTLVAMSGPMSSVSDEASSRNPESASVLFPSAG